MFKKSVRKIVATVMSVLVAFFAATITLIYVLNYADMKKRSSDSLIRYVTSYTLGDGYDFIPTPLINEDAPSVDGKNDKPSDKPLGYEFAVFYSVAFSQSGEVIKVNNFKTEIMTDDVLTEKARTVLASGKNEGSVDSLSYMVAEKQGYTLVAFIDNSMMKGDLSVLLKIMLIVGGTAVFIFFFVSYFIAKKIVAPLQENDERQKRFVSDAGHELKTPVSVISANAEILSRELGDNKWLDNIKYENGRMSELIKDLLDLSRAENATAALERVDMKRLVVGEILPFESVAFDQGSIIREDLDDGIEINGNPAQLKQLVSILIDNAVRHGDGGEIVVSLKKVKKSVLFYVENDGKAIPKEQTDKIFERFYRADESRTDDGNHYGLGLAIAKAIVKAHRGDIGVKCENGKVRFFVVFE